METSRASRQKSFNKQRLYAAPPPAELSSEGRIQGNFEGELTERALTIIGFTRPRRQQSCRLMTAFVETSGSS